MRQHWDLGQALRRRYDGFLNASYNRQEVSTQSLFTTIDRRSVHNSYLLILSAQLPSSLLPRLQWVIINQRDLQTVMFTGIVSFSLQREYTLGLVSILLKVEL